MGRIVSNFFTSLGGVVEFPEQWHFQYFNHEMAAAIGVGAAACAAFLVGRVLYEEWAGCWPGQLRTEPDGDANPAAAADAPRSVQHRHPLALLRSRRLIAATRAG